MAGLVRFTEEVSCQPDTCLASQVLTCATIRSLRWIHIQAPICGVSWKVFSYFPRDRELGSDGECRSCLGRGTRCLFTQFLCLFHNMTEAHSPDGIFLRPNWKDIFESKENGSERVGDRACRENDRRGIIVWSEGGP